MGPLGAGGGDPPGPAALAGRVALVTGGGSGIGQATARLLAAAGAHVVVADLDANNARSTATEFGGAAVEVASPAAGAGVPGPRAVAVEVDLTDPAGAEAMVAAAVEAFGRIDVAVNAAGISGSYGNIVDQEVDEWRRMIDVNLTSVYLSVRAELRQMLAQDPVGGVIVNVASAAGSMGVPGLAHYSAAKHGVIGLTKSAALEVARSGIRVNVVLPGTVRTPMLQRFAGGDEGVDKMGRVTPVGRVAESPEIAQAILWLCTDAASYVTGAALPVDGGALAT